MQVKAIYPGRFHPFHKGHAASFKQLADSFGLENTYLALSEKQEQPKSPFAAGDRAKMAMALGIPKENIISVRNTYGADEYIKRFEAAGIDPNQTALIFGVSGKDMGADPRFSFAPKKDGSPSYLQPYGDELQPMTKHAYVVTTNVAEFPIAGQSMTDASQIRSAYVKGDDKMKAQILTDLYGNAAKLIKPIFDKNLQLSESIYKKIVTLKAKLNEYRIKERFTVYDLDNNRALHTTNDRDEAEQECVEWAMHDDIRVCVIDNSLGRPVFEVDGYDEAMDQLDSYDLDEGTADDINKMFGNMYDPTYSALQRVALLAMQGRQDEAMGKLRRVIKDASPEAQSKIIDAVNSIEPVTINGRIADSSILDKSKQHQDWIKDTFIPWVEHCISQQPVDEGIVLNPADLIDVFIKGKHKKNSVTFPVAKGIPNKNLEKVVELLVTKYKVNPNTIIYGPSKSEETNEDMDKDLTDRHPMDFTKRRFMIKQIAKATGWDVSDIELASDEEIQQAYDEHVKSESYLEEN